MEEQKRYKEFCKWMEENKEYILSPNKSFKEIKFKAYDVKPIEKLNELQVNIPNQNIIITDVYGETAISSGDLIWLYTASLLFILTFFSLLIGGIIS